MAKFFIALLALFDKQTETTQSSLLAVNDVMCIVLL